MKLRLDTRISAGLVMLLVAGASSVSAAEYPLFPVAQSAATPKEMSAPEQIPPLNTLEPAAGAPTPAAHVAASGNGEPLRLVIPNVNAQEKKPEVKKQAATVAPSTAANTAAMGAQALFLEAKEAWNNGVMIVSAGVEFVARSVYKPVIAFSEVPVQWATVGAPESVSQASAQAVAALAPAAGEATPAAADANQVVLPQDALVTAVEKPLVQEVKTELAAAPQAAVAANDVSEPAPTLSSQSKEILNKVPTVADKKEPKPTARKVDIEHAQETQKIPDATVATKENAALGLKVGGAKSKFSTSYELERAYNALVAGKAEDAMQIYEDILTSDPKNKDALFGLATTYHRAGQIDMARSLYAKLLQLDPKNREGLNNFLVLLADEAPQEALAEMEKLESKNPGFSPIPAQMAIIYQKLGDLEKAVDKMYRALASAPENLTYRYNLAIMMDKSGRFSEAVKLYTQLLDANAKGAKTPGDIHKIQQRLTFLRSNTQR